MHVVAKPSLVALLALRGGLDAKWTPNGEAPEPYSTNARQAAGMDPAQMAGAAAGMPGQPQGAPPAPGATLQFSLLALLVFYLANNWKLVQGIQDIVMKMLAPFINASAVRKETQAKEAAADAAAAAREARAARLRAAKSKSSSKKAAADDDE